MKRLLPCLVAALLLLAVSQEAEAQLGVNFGPELSYNAEVEEVGIGARVELAPLAVPLSFFVSVDYVFVDDTMWDIGVSAKYTISLPGAPIGPYLGAGVSHQRFSNGGSFDDTGFHILGGVGLGGLLPVGAFLEGRFLIMDALDNQFVIVAGVLF